MQQLQAPSCFSRPCPKTTDPTQIRLSPGMLVSMGSCEEDIFECIAVTLNSAEFRPLPTSPSFPQGNVVLSPEECFQCVIHPSEETYEAIEYPQITVSTITSRRSLTSPALLSSLSLTVQIDILSPARTCVPIEVSEDNASKANILRLQLPQFSASTNAPSDCAEPRSLVEWPSFSSIGSWQSTSLVTLAESPLNPTSTEPTPTILRREALNIVVQTPKASLLSFTEDLERLRKGFLSVGVVSEGRSSSLELESLPSIRSAESISPIAITPINTMSSPKDTVRDWTPLDVRNWIAKLRDPALKKYAGRFYEQKVSGVELGRVTLGYLHNKLLILNRVHRKQLLHEIQNLVQACFVQNERRYSYKGRML